MVSLQLFSLYSYGTCKSCQTAQVRAGPKVSFCSRRTDYKGTENLKQVVLLKATLWQGTVSSYRKINFPYFSTQANVHSITHVRKCLQSPGDTIGNQKKLFCFCGKFIVWYKARVSSASLNTRVSYNLMSASNWQQRKQNAPTSIVIYSGTVHTQVL